MGSSMRIASKSSGTAKTLAAMMNRVIFSATEIISTLLDTQYRNTMMLTVSFPQQWRSERCA
jgi:hypothetical protein